MKVDNSKFDNTWFVPGRSKIIQVLWYFTNSIVFNSSLFPINSVKLVLLRFFGANIGQEVIIKPCVNIKYPWKLEIGDNTWIGENVWIDNLADVKIGNNVCISQGAMLLTGNHDYKKSSFDLIIGEIELEDGTWIGAKSIVCPGVRCCSHSILAVNSVATKDMAPYTIYQGNPAKSIRKRQIIT